MVKKIHLTMIILFFYHKFMIFTFFRIIMFIYHNLHFTDKKIIIMMTSVTTCTKHTCCFKSREEDLQARASLQSHRTSIESLFVTHFTFNKKVKLQVIWILHSAMLRF